MASRSTKHRRGSCGNGSAATWMSIKATSMVSPRARASSARTSRSRQACPPWRCPARPIRPKPNTAEQRKGNGGDGADRTPTADVDILRDRRYRPLAFATGEKCRHHLVKTALGHEAKAKAMPLLRRSAFGSSRRRSTSLALRLSGNARRGRHGRLQGNGAWLHRRGRHHDCGLKLRRHGRHHVGSRGRRSPRRRRGCADARR